MKANFQIIVVIVFIAAAVFGIMVFSGAIPLGSQNNKTGGQGTVVLWGTVSSLKMAPIIENFNLANPTFGVKYVQKYPETFNQDLLEALASGTGPDMFFMPDNLAVSYKNKIFTIPYTSYPISAFKNNFAGAGEVFMTKKGIIAFPLTIDPLVMYYNRSILDSNSIIYPPKYWDEIPALVSTLTQKDESNKIIKSAFALGQFSNVNHAKDILSAMFMQTGNPIVAEKDGAFVSVLDGSSGQKYNSSSVLKFYTDFSDPLGSLYSWNKSLPNSSDAFSSESLAFYFGYASELETMVNKNPNENFLATSMPQIRGSNLKLAGARVMGVAISSFSKNFNTAFTAASLMATGSFSKDLSDTLGVAPARRDLFSQKHTDAYTPTFYSSALFARSWLDPSPLDSENIFRSMVEKVVSNIMSPDDAISEASSKLSLLLNK